MDLNGIILSALMIWGTPLIFIAACVKEIKAEKKTEERKRKAVEMRSKYEYLLDPDYYGD